MVPLISCLPVQCTILRDPVEVSPRWWHCGQVSQEGGIARVGLDTFDGSCYELETHSSWILELSLPLVVVVVVVL